MASLVHSISLPHIFLKLPFERIFWPPVSTTTFQIKSTYSIHTVVMTDSAESKTEESVPLVLQDLKRFSASPKDLFDKSATAMPVAAIKALLGVVERSQAPIRP